MALLILGFAINANAVLKEANLDSTLQILRTELTKYYFELETQNAGNKKQNEQIRDELISVMKKCNQYSMMLYSQKNDYVFDLTYACHEATELYKNFQHSQLPFKQMMLQNSSDIARYDSLRENLKAMPVMMLSKQAKVDRNVCLTLASSIHNMLEENQAMVNDYIKYYKFTERRLDYLNRYANKRYDEIKDNIFVNGGFGYWDILKNIGYSIDNSKRVISEKYQPKKSSQWNSQWMLGLFIMIGIYAIIASILNIIVIRFLIPQRFRTEEFMKKRACTIMASTTITFGILLSIVHATFNQNFIIMASNLFVEYAWMLGAILVSLLLRVKGDQIKSAFRVYTPLIAIGFIVFTFRIILIPNELVNLIFPPILLLCALWQWNVIKRHNKNIPHSDKFYSYTSLVVFITSVICSWMGFTLLSVQILIWWTMQLTCILTITCIGGYIELYGNRHDYHKKPITQKWMFNLVQKVIIPIAVVISILFSIYWTADVFNLSALCWDIFKTHFINMPNLQISMLKIVMVVNLWFIFSYISNTILQLMRIHYVNTDPATAESREVMGRNVIQVLVWGVWLLGSLSILHISVAWLLAISGGLSTGIGFASKDIIENVWYGASLMAGRIKVGDWIEVDGTRGRVTSISYTSTMVESLYGEVIAFQNSQLFTKNYKNLTKNHGYVLAVIPFGVAYGCNIKQVTQLIEETVNNTHFDWVDPNKQIKSVVSEMGDNSINFKLFVWADAVKKSYVISDVLKCVYETLNKHNIEIPFPQRDIHIKNIDELRK